MAQQITFAGVTTKITPRGQIRRPAYLKMLRSGKVRLVRTNLTTDCDQTDEAHKRDAMADPDVLVRLADEIEQSPDGWWADIERDGKLRVCCHTFLSYRIEECEPEPEPKKMDPDTFRKAVAAVVAPIFAKAVAGEMPAHRVLPEIARLAKRETGCSDDDAIAFASGVAAMLREAS